MELPANTKRQILTSLITEAESTIFRLTCMGRAYSAIGIPNDAKESADKAGKIEMFKADLEKQLEALGPPDAAQ